MINGLFISTKDVLCSTPVQRDLLRVQRNEERKKKFVKYDSKSFALTKHKIILRHMLQSISKKINIYPHLPIFLNR